MESYTGTIEPEGIYVRALYDYEADDVTSLSFRHGDLIQVLTQLESGWWDGVIGNVRGWFPSNYCEFVDAHEAEQEIELRVGRDPHDIEPDLSSDGDYDTDFEDSRGLSRNQSDVLLHANGEAKEQDNEGAFWIPQATPDGRLFYFNTLTGVSIADLPLESSNANGEHPSRSLSDTSRPPPEMMVGGYERDDDTDADTSASEAESFSKPSRFKGKPQSQPDPRQMSNIASSATSLESAEPDQRMRQRSLPHSSFSSRTAVEDPSNRTGVNHVIPNAAHTTYRFGQNGARTYTDEVYTMPLTWDRLVEDMRRAVERYRQAIQRRQRDEFVRRAEDISDHLRLLLAAGSGTTDNHSGVPSIISTNKSLYPHFRDMMSRFSKLVLSSHISSADFAAPDQFAKCLQEADGMLIGVYGFVEVARQQRGEEIPRLFPGFIMNTYSGGSWQNNGIPVPESRASSIAEDDHEPLVEPSTPLDDGVLERMNELKRSIVNGIRRLEERLVIQDKVISESKHMRFAHEVCSAAGNVIQLYRPWLATMESLDLSGSGLTLESAQFQSYSNHKQNVFIGMGELMMSSQNLAAPLADEWSSEPGESLQERVTKVLNVVKNLDASTSQVHQLLQVIASLVPDESLSVVVGPGPSGVNPSRAPAARYDDNGLDELDLGKEFDKYAPSPPPKPYGRSMMNNPDAFVDYSDTNNAAAGLYVNADSSKVTKFFGEAPVIRTQANPSSEATASHLSLDHEGEVQYDMKTDPPTIKGGTLVGLVEQLTRHDRYDAPFKTTFLLTYQSFTNGPQLFEHLVRRWSIQPPPDLNYEAKKEWMVQKQGPIRFRIVNVFKSWFDTFWMEGSDQASQELVSRVCSFVRDTIRVSNTPGAAPLLSVVEQRMRGEDTTAKKLVPNPNFQQPLPILPKNLKKIKFTEIDPTEFARQLTIIESRLYGKIKPQECLNKTWQKKINASDAEPAPNLKALILHSNRLTNWVAEMILSHSEPKKRANVIKHFVAVANQCHSICNFSTLVSIVSAMGTAPIHRLNRTWSCLNKASAATLEKMRKLMHSTKNFAQYRQALREADPPCIPFFGVYLTDLTFIEDGMPHLIKKTELINFAKRAKTADVIREIQTYQNVSYPFKAVPELQDYILTMIQSAEDVNKMYDRSLQVEPREREDEKIARLLTESGFL